MDTLLIISYAILRVFMAPWHLAESAYWFAWSLRDGCPVPSAQACKLAAQRHRLEAGLLLLRAYRPLLGSWTADMELSYKKDLLTVNLRMAGLTERRPALF